MDILLELGAKELDMLRKTFLQNHGLSLPEFVTAMLELLPEWWRVRERRLSTAKMLIDAFAQVDINGDGNMSWEEMMAALIDAGSPTGFKQAAKHAFRFHEHDNFSRATRHSLRVARLKYIPHLRLLAALEEGRRVVTFYGVGQKDDPEEGYQVVCEIDTAVQGEAEGGEVFDMAYIPEHNILVLAVGDFSLQFWDCRPLAHRMPASALGPGGIPKVGGGAAIGGGGSGSNTNSTTGDGSGNNGSGASTNENNAFVDAALASQTEGDGSSSSSKSNSTNGSGDRPSSSSFNSNFSISNGNIQKKRKPLPSKPDEVQSVHGNTSSEADAGKQKSGGGGADNNASSTTPNDDDDDNDADLMDLGPMKEITVQIAGRKGPVFVTKVHCPNPQRLLTWVGAGTSKLLSAGVSAEILVWHVRIVRLGFGVWDIRAHNRGVLHAAHTRQVTDMITLRDIGLVASCSLDGSIAFWGIRGMSDGAGGRRGFKDSAGYKSGAALPRGASAGGVYLASLHNDGKAHRRGVRTLCWIPSVRMLLSGGYETHITAWDMTLDDGTPIYSLQGHTSGIIGMTSLEPDDFPFDAKANKAVSGMAGGTSSALVALKKKLIHYAHMVSVDEVGEFKWWDCSRDNALVEDTRCLQSFVPNFAGISKQKYSARSVVCARFSFDPFAAASPSAAASVAAGGSSSSSSSSSSTATRSGGEGDDENTAGPSASDAATVDAAVTEAAEGASANGAAVIIGLGPRWTAFEAIRQDDDRAVPVGCLYHDITMSLLAVCQQDIRVFEASTGVMSRVYRSALPADASPGCVVFDARRRKMVIGCNGGAVIVLNTFNCAIMKSLPRHFADVSGVQYCPEDSLVITTSWDGRIHISDETIQEMDGKTQGLLRRVKHAHGKGVPITASTFDHSLSLIASAGASLAIFVWDYQDVAFQGACVGHDAEITALAFAAPYPALVSADSGGVINVWSVERGKAFMCLASFGHNPMNFSTPMPANHAEEAVAYERQTSKKRIAAATSLATWKALRHQSKRAASSANGSATSAHPHPHHHHHHHHHHNSTTSSNVGNFREVMQRLIVGPGVAASASAVYEPVTCLTVIPPLQMLLSKVTSPVGDVEYPAETSTNGASKSMASQYPVLVVGDDTGRISFWDLGFVLGDLAINIETKKLDAEEEMRSRRYGEYDESSLSVVTILGGYDSSSSPATSGTATSADHLLNVTVGNVNTTTATTAAVNNNSSSNARYFIRKGFEKISEAKFPSHAPSYHPRKIIKRSGPSSNLVALSVAPLLEDIVDEDATGDVDTGTKRGTGRRMLSKAKAATIAPSSANSHNNNNNHGKTTSIASTPLSSKLQTTSPRKGAGGDTTSKMSRSSKPFTPLSGTGIGGAATNGIGMVGSLDAAFELEGDASAVDQDAILANDTWTFDIADILVADAAEQRRHAAVARGDPMETGRTTDNEDEEEGKKQDEAEADDDGSPNSPAERRRRLAATSSLPIVNDNPLNAPSSRIPLLARAVGDAWKPTRLLYAHGVFFRSNGSGSSASSSAAGAAIRDGGIGTSWRGFAVRNIRLAHSIDLACLTSVGDDGTVRMVSLDGTILGALPVSTGRRPPVRIEPGVGGRPSLVIPPSEVHELAGGGGAPSNPSAAAAQAVEWDVHLDIVSRDTVVSASAMKVLDHIDAEAAHSARVQRAMQNNSVYAVAYADVKQHERRTRRSSIVASAAYMEPEEAKRVARELAIAKAGVVDIHRGAGGGHTSEGHNNTAANTSTEEHLHRHSHHDSHGVESAEAGITRTRLFSQLLGNERDGSSAGKRTAAAHTERSKSPTAMAALRDLKASSLQSKNGGMIMNVLDTDTGTSKRTGGKSAASPSDGGGSMFGVGADGMDPTVRTLLELTQVDAEERAARVLAQAGKPKLYRGTGKKKSGSNANANGLVGEDEDEDDETEGKRGKDDDSMPKVTVEELRSRMSEADKRLAKVRSVAIQADSNAASGTVKLGNLVLEDPTRKAALLKQLEREKRQYPAMYAELTRSLNLVDPSSSSGGTAASEGAVTAGLHHLLSAPGSSESISDTAHALSEPTPSVAAAPSMPLSSSSGNNTAPTSKTGGGGGAVTLSSSKGEMSAFLAANLHKLSLTKPATPKHHNHLTVSTASLSSSSPLASSSSSISSPMVTNKSVSMKSSVNVTTDEDGTVVLGKVRVSGDLSHTHKNSSGASSAVSHSLTSPSSSGNNNNNNSKTATTPGATTTSAAAAGGGASAVRSARLLTSPTAASRLAKADALLGILNGSIDIPEASQTGLNLKTSSNTKGRYNNNNDNDDDFEDESGDSSTRKKKQIAPLSPAARLTALYNSTKRTTAVASSSARRASVIELLHERNPELVKQLQNAKEKNERGMIMFASMDEEEVLDTANKLMAEHEKGLAIAAASKQAEQADRTGALDAVVTATGEKGTTQQQAMGDRQVSFVEGQHNTTQQNYDTSTSMEKTKETTKHRSPSPGHKKKDDPHASPTKGAGDNNHNSKKKLPQKRIPKAGHSAIRIPMLSPEQYYIMAKKSRIGGQFKREVTNFTEMLRRIDTDKSGYISYEEFVAEIESGKSGMAHMKRHLESMFRAADKDGSGELSIFELVDIMFPKATLQQRGEIVSFVSYVGPPPQLVAKAPEKVFSEETIQQMKELFNIYDTDGSGSIDRSEMAAVLQAMAGIMGPGSGGLFGGGANAQEKKPSHSSASKGKGGKGGGGGHAPGPQNAATIAALEDAERIMSSADDSGDGEISFDEFIKLMGPAFEPDDFDV